MRASILSHAEEDAETISVTTRNEVDRKRAEYYIKTMKRIQEKGKKYGPSSVYLSLALADLVAGLRRYVKSESARLSRLLDGSISADRKTTLTERRNILAAFVRRKDDLAR